MKKLIPSESNILKGVQRNSTEIRISIEIEYCFLLKQELANEIFHICRTGQRAETLENLYD